MQLLTKQSVAHAAVFSELVMATLRRLNPKILNSPEVKSTIVEQSMNILNGEEV